MLFHSPAFIFGFLPLPLAVTGLRFFAYGVRPDPGRVASDGSSPR